eukprot:CAMPEP_0175102960 /NCGR_PEP_ID=MMETSP0086_2-20121207/8770_1 /TAXON_ID=136419 /ORGANISM="Unknown Unknown, Strain D1" /LENGTH=141 /DNA_ID=CAMNT_0016377915 /DNA_START=292 /DNA_END=717 /DNA_ORIENTATION=-
MVLAPSKLVRNMSAPSHLNNLSGGRNLSGPPPIGDHLEASQEIQSILSQSGTFQDLSRSLSLTGPQDLTRSLPGYEMNTPVNCLEHAGSDTDDDEGEDEGEGEDEEVEAAMFSPPLRTNNPVVSDSRFDKIMKKRLFRPTK